MVNPLPHHHRRPVVEDNDGVGLHVAHSLDQCDLLRGEIEVGAVVAFRLLVGRQRDVEQGHRRIFGDVHGLVDEVLAERIVGRVALGVQQFGAPGLLL